MDNPFNTGAPQNTHKEKKSLNLFGSKPKELAIDPEAVNNQLNNVSLRLRVLEERYTNLRRKTQVIEQNMLNAHKQIKEEIKMNNSDMTDMKRDIKDIKNKMRQIVLELKNCALKEDLNVLRKYVEMWEPINFVTQNQAEKMIQEAIDEQLGNNKKI
ncbi:MAG: hypothetical protein ABII01_04860 [Candidatus Woesearchaeota archaeon]